MTETPIGRLKQLLELLKKLPEDLEAIAIMAEDDEELRRTLSDTALEIMRLNTNIMMKMAIIMARRMTGYGDTGTN